MTSLLERMEQREEATQAQVEELRAELAAMAERLAAEEQLLERLQITKTTVIEVLADDDPGKQAGVGAVTVAPASAGCRFPPSPRIRRLPGGWLVEVEPGLFTCASGVAGTLNGTGGNSGGTGEADEGSSS